MWVSPFRYLRINRYLLLPAAFRSLSRLSSALSAKASTLRSFLLDLCYEHLAGNNRKCRWQLTCDACLTLDENGLLAKFESSSQVLFSFILISFFHTYSVRYGVFLKIESCLFTLIVILGCLDI